MGSLASDMEKDIVALSPAGHDQLMAPEVFLRPLRAWSSPDMEAARPACDTQSRATAAGGRAAVTWSAGGGRRSTHPCSSPSGLGAAAQRPGRGARRSARPCHRGAAFELQLSGPLAELLEGALLIGAPVELAVLRGGLGLRGL